MTNADRRRLLDEFRASGMEGSILDVYKAFEQGVDLIADHQAKQEQASMARPGTPISVPPNTPTTTVRQEPTNSGKWGGRPVDISSYDREGHLVDSYKAVPAGIVNLPTGPHAGEVLQTPTEYKHGGAVKREHGGPHTPEATADPRLAPSNQTISQEQVDYDDSASLLDMLTAPLQTARVLNRMMIAGDVSWPTNAQMTAAGTQAMDMALEAVNPAAWQNYGGKAIADLADGDFVGAGLNALGALPAIPGGKAIVSAAKRSKGLEKMVTKVVDQTSKTIGRETARQAEKGAKLINKNAKRITDEINTDEGRRRIAAQFAEARAGRGASKLSNWEMDQLVDNRIDAIAGSMASSPNVRYAAGQIDPSTFSGFPRMNANFSGGSLFSTTGRPTSGVLGSMARGKNTMVPQVPGKSNREVLEMYNNLQKKTMPELVETGNKDIPFMLSKKGKLESPVAYSGNITIGKHMNSLAILEHELGHAFQQGVKTPLDGMLQSLVRKFDKLGSVVSPHFKYISTGSKGKEPLAHAFEARQFLRDQGLIKGRYDEITAEILEQAYQKSSGLIKHLQFREGSRLITLVPDKAARAEFFKELAPLMNKLPATIGAGAVAGVAAQGDRDANIVRKRGGLVDRRKRK